MPSPTNTRCRPSAELAQAAAELLAGQPIAARRWSIWSNARKPSKSNWPPRCFTPPATTPIAKFATWLPTLPAARVTEIIELGLRHRGKHDEALRAFHAGAALRFDILMDIGGFRDMHRHRRCTQIIQPFTALHGYETPTCGDLGPGQRQTSWPKPAPGRFQSAIEAAHAASAQIAASHAPEAAQSALYLLPLATRIRSLFKMDFAEAQYISELRSGTRRPLQLSPRSLGDVSSPATSASIPC